MSVQADKLLATLAKMKNEEAQHRAKKSLEQATNRRFLTLEKANSQYVISYPYPHPDEIMWNNGEGIVFARELEIHLSVMYPVVVAIRGEVMTMGFSQGVLQLSIILKENSRKPRTQDIRESIAAFGLKHEMNDNWSLGNRLVKFYFNEFESKYS